MLWQIYQSVGDVYKRQDEPTGNLDSKTSQDVLSLLKVTSQKFAQTIVMIDVYKRQA